AAGGTAAAQGGTAALARPHFGWPAGSGGARAAGPDAALGARRSLDLGGARGARRSSGPTSAVSADLSRRPLLGAMARTAKVRPSPGLDVALWSAKVPPGKPDQFSWRRPNGYACRTVVRPRFVPPMPPRIS